MLGSDPFQNALWAIVIVGSAATTIVLAVRALVQQRRRDRGED